MSSDPAFLNWWGKVRVLLEDAQLKWPLVEIAESDKLVYTGKRLAKQVTQTRRNLSENQLGALDDDESYETHALSEHLRDNFEELGLVQRPAKGKRDDQSIIFISGWLSDFLARQNLEEKEVADPQVDERGMRMIDYLDQHIDDDQVKETKDSDNRPRLLASLEAVLYAYVDECATLQGSEIDFEIGSPEILDEEKEAIFESLYADTESNNRAAPMPKLPQHREIEDWDQFLDYTIVGKIRGVRSVQRPKRLRDELEGQLLTWAAGVLEAYARSGDIDTDADSALSAEDAYPELPEDVVDRRAAEIVKYDVDSPHERFGIHTTIAETAEEIRFGLYLRSDINTNEPIPSLQPADAEAEDD
jgi:hypothetical protein